MRIVHTLWNSQRHIVHCSAHSGGTNLPGGELNKGIATGLFGVLARGWKHEPQRSDLTIGLQYAIELFAVSVRRGGGGKR